jgi:iron(III) transport system substrate-binding protein
MDVATQGRRHLWHGRGKSRWGLVAILLVTSLIVAACTGSDDDTGTAANGAAESSGSITLYSGRSESLIGPLIEQFETATGIDVHVRYGDTAALAATLLEEGDRSPADVYLAQDAGALGAIEDAGLFTQLPASQLDPINDSFKSGNGQWVGVSGRARVIVHSTDLQEAELPQSVFDLTAPEWRGRVGWAPTNGSFQAFVTAMREIHGEAVTEAWLRDMLANGVQEYPNNSTQVQAVGDGEIEIGLVNHYYLFRFLAEDPNFPAANRYTDPGESGALINVAGVGILASSQQRQTALRFVEYLLDEEAQTYFRDETSEYPLIGGIAPRDGIPSLETLSPPSLRLTSLADLEGTLDLLREVGALP